MPEFSLFVGDISPEVTDHMLLQAFAGKFSSVSSAQVMTDPVSGLSKGYGFVRLTSEAERDAALHEMQGVYCGNKQIRVSMANARRSDPPATGTSFYSAATPAAATYPDAGDQGNSTVFVGNLHDSVTEDDLRQAFEAVGPVSYVRIPGGKNCGFVQFMYQNAAEAAINTMNGASIGPSRIRLAWGKSGARVGGAMPSSAVPAAYSYGGFSGSSTAAASPYAQSAAYAANSASYAAYYASMYGGYGAGYPGITTPAATATSVAEPEPGTYARSQGMDGYEGGSSESSSPAHTLLT